MGCELRRPHPPGGKHDSSYVVACLCSFDSLGDRSGLARESRRLTRPHCVVESRRPLEVGLVAGGVTLLIIIVGGGNAWHELSTCITANMDGAESDAVELVDGRCSWRKLGKSGAARESRRLRVAPTIFGGGVDVAIESRLLLR